MTPLAPPKATVTEVKLLGKLKPPALIHATVPVVLGKKKRNHTLTMLPTRTRLQGYNVLFLGGGDLNVP